MTGSSLSGYSNRIVDRIAIALCLGALLYPITGFLVRSTPKVLVPRPLPSTIQSDTKRTSSGFAIGAFPNLAPPTYLKGPLDLYGSFLDRGDSVGNIETPLYKAVPDFYIFV